jgi:hypothetical protein
VKRVVEVEYDGLVYDLTTESHHFAAGAGQLVVHNTDSIMVRFEPGAKDPEVLARCITKGKEAARRITEELFMRPISLEYEKTFHPYLLCSKKRYAGLYHTEADSKPFVAAKGLDLVRRDRIPLVRDLQKEILDMVLWKRDLQGAVQRIRSIASDLLTGKVPLLKLVLSKQLKGSYKNPEAQPHVTVVRKIEARLPGSQPQAGDRVPYVFLELGDPKANSSLMAEDPAYAEKNNLPINYLYYLEHGLITPLSTILEAFVTRGNAKDILFKDLIRDYKVKRAGNRQITAFFRPREPAESQWKRPKQSHFMIIDTEQNEAGTSVAAEELPVPDATLAFEAAAQAAAAMGGDLKGLADEALEQKIEEINAEMSKLDTHSVEWRKLRDDKKPVTEELRRRFLADQ